jgi:hypothetical protein
VVVRRTRCRAVTQARGQISPPARGGRRKARIARAGRYGWKSCRHKTLGKIAGTDRHDRIEVELDEEILGRKIWPVVPHLAQFADSYSREIASSNFS